MGNGYGETHDHPMLDLAINELRGQVEELWTAIEDLRGQVTELRSLVMTVAPDPLVDPDDG